jgi:hypothetical protein
MLYLRKKATAGNESMISIFNNFLKKDRKKYKNAEKNLKKHWNEIQNIEKIDFGGIFKSYKMQHIHRHFLGKDFSLLAVFAAFEFLHNLDSFIDTINSERRMKAINHAAGTELCVIESSITNNDISEENNCRPFMIEYYKRLINELKEGKIRVSQELWNYIGLKRETAKGKMMEKKAAVEAINILTYPSNIIEFIEKSIDGNYNLK